MIQGHLVSQTHWDREWYLSRMQFLPRLVRMVDGLLEMLDTTPGYYSFMLDGQLSALEDYLQVRPENKARVKAAVAAGKISLGPWYVLPDELLVSGESHIRNYLAGQRMAKEFGPAMQVGYLPDSFGHPEQMPQILHGLGLNEIIFWRGVPNELDKSEFWWEGPDGASRVLCVHMPNGYGTAACLQKDDPNTPRRLKNMMDLLGAKSSTNVVLLMNGSDHLLADRDIPTIVEDFNAAATDHRLVMSTLPDFLAALRAALPEDLKTHRGTLYSGDKTILLGGTLSTRMPLKQHNHLVQKQMERYLEPLISHERLCGGTFDFHGYQNYLWKLILENHPHDSICGCGIDPVHTEMMTRFGCVEQLQEKMLADTCERLGDGSTLEADAQALVFIPTQDRLPSYVEVEVNFDYLMKHRQDHNISTTRELPGELPPPPTGVEAVDEAGRPVPCVLLQAVPDRYIMDFPDDDQPRVYHANRVRLALLLPGMDYGVHALNFRKKDGSAAGVTHPDRLENEFYILRFDTEDAAFVVTDKKTGKTHRQVARLVDMGDAGDEYSYSWPDEDLTLHLEPENITSIDYRQVEDLAGVITVKGMLNLPAALTEDRRARGSSRVGCPIVLSARLVRGADRVDFELELDNQAKDHRLQVAFPAGTLTTETFGSAAFAITRHPVERPVPPVWQEYPQAATLTHGFVGAGTAQGGVTLASLGMTEYESENTPEQTVLRLTLLRCVGWASLAGLNTRPINGGWEVESPGGQCIGHHRFAFSATWHPGTWQTGHSYTLVDQALHPPYIHQVDTSVPTNNPLAFLSRLPAEVRVSAVKPAENSQSIILRLYSLADRPTRFDLQPPPGVKAVWRVNLIEERAEMLPMDPDRTLHIEMPPCGILSLELAR